MAHMYVRGDSAHLCCVFLAAGRQGRREHRGWGHAESLPQVLPPVHRLDTHELCSARKAAARLHGVPCGILTVSLACAALHSSRVKSVPVLLHAPREAFRSAALLSLYAAFRETGA